MRDNMYKQGISELEVDISSQVIKGQTYFLQENYTEAERWLQTPAKKGEKDAQTLLGYLYEVSEAHRDLDKALFWYEQAAQRGDAIAVDALIRLYKEAGTAKRDKLKYWQDKQERGLLGNVYAKKLAENRQNAPVQKKAAPAPITQEVPQKHNTSNTPPAKTTAETANEILVKIDKTIPKTNLAERYKAAVNLLNDTSERSNSLAARIILKDLGDEGHADALNMLGEIYYEGTGVIKDGKKALSYYEQAYKKGNLDACYSIGYMLTYGNGVKEDVSTGMNYLLEAANAGHPKAYRHLGFLYFWGKRVEQDFDKSFRYMKTAADKGDAAAQTHVAQAYITEKWGAPERNISLANQYYNKALTQENEHAQWCVGQHYNIGDCEYEKDPHKAYTYFKKSAENGSNKGQLSLALCYIRGSGVEQNYEEARKWLEKAMAGGNSEAKARLGILLLSCVYSNSPLDVMRGKDFLREAVSENESDEVAAEALKRLTGIEARFGPLENIVAKGESACRIASLCEEDCVAERQDRKLLELEREVEELENQQDVLRRVSIANSMLHAHAALKLEFWDDCFSRVQEALEEIGELHSPTGDDIRKKKEAYAYLAVSTFKLAEETGEHTYQEASAYFEKAKPFEGVSAEMFSEFYDEFCQKQNARSAPASLPKTIRRSPEDARAMEDTAVSELIDEAVAVINDMLEAGSGANIFSVLDHEGFIIVVPDARKSSWFHTDYGFRIEMYNVSDLRTCVNRYPRMRENPQNSDMIEKFDSFVRRYSGYYDAKHSGYVYYTRNTISIKKGSDEQNKLKALLFREVERRCPLADFEGTPIHNKKIAH